MLRSVLRARVGEGALLQRRSYGGQQQAREALQHAEGWLLKLTMRDLWQPPPQAQRPGMILPRDRPAAAAQYVERPHEQQQEHAQAGVSAIYRSSCRFHRSLVKGCVPRLDCSDPRG